MAMSSGQESSGILDAEEIVDKSNRMDTESEGHTEDVVETKEVDDLEAIKSITNDNVDNVDKIDKVVDEKAEQKEKEEVNNEVTCETSEEEMKKIKSILHDDKYDVAKWIDILHVAIASTNYEQASSTFYTFFDLFPTAVRYWRLFAEKQISLFANSSDKVERENLCIIIDGIFQKSLFLCPAYEFWKTYLEYVTQKTSDYGEIARAYDFCLLNVGYDINSYDMWMKCINHAHTLPTESRRDETTKVTTLRKLYHRALQQPIHRLDLLWNHYEKWEKTRPSSLTDGLLAEWSKRIEITKKVYVNRKSTMDGILRNMLPKPITKNTNVKHGKEGKQFELWKNYLQFEKANPQRVDPKTLQERMKHSFNQFLLCFYRYPEVWYDAATYSIDNSFVEDGIDFFVRGIKACNDCPILNFSLAAVYEKNNLEQCHKVYSELLELYPDMTLAQIQYLKFLRRTDGTDASRAYFRKVVKTTSCTHKIYIAAARLEYYTNKNVDFAQVIFESGLKRFGNNLEIIREYLKIMKNLNDESNVRSLYERFISCIPSEKAQEVWSSFLEFEYERSGDISFLDDLEKRRQTFCPDTIPFPQAGRYRFLDLLPFDQSFLDYFWDQTTRKQKTNRQTSVGDDYYCDYISPSAVKSLPRPETIFLHEYIPGKPPQASAIGGGGQENKASSQVDRDHDIDDDRKRFEDEDRNKGGGCIPDPLLKFLSQLPHPRNYYGPVVPVNQLIDVFLHSFDRKNPVQQIRPADDIRGSKRPRSQYSATSKRTKLEGSDQNMISQAPPTRDIFRSRQAAKLSKQ